MTTPRRSLAHRIAPHVPALWIVLWFVSLIVICATCSGCDESHVRPIAQTDAGVFEGDAAPPAYEPECAEWAASPGSEYHEGSPEDVRCVRWE